MNRYYSEAAAIQAITQMASIDFIIIIKRNPVNPLYVDGFITVRTDGEASSTMTGIGVNPDVMMAKADVYSEVIKLFSTEN